MQRLPFSKVNSTPELKKHPHRPTCMNTCSSNSSSRHTQLQMVSAMPTHPALLAWHLSNISNSSGRVLPVQLQLLPRLLHQHLLSNNSLFQQVNNRSHEDMLQQGSSAMQVTPSCSTSKRFTTIKQPIRMSSVSQ